MSNRRQRRAKQVRRTNQRAALRLRRPPLPGEIVAQMLCNAADELLGPSMLRAELAASDIAAPAWATIFDSPRSAAEHVAYPAFALTRMLESQVISTDQLVLDAALALALLLASSDATDADLASASAELVAKLREAGASEPAWVSELGHYELAETWIMRDPWCTQIDLLIGVSAPDPKDDHTLVVQGDQLRGFQIQRAFVEDPVGTLVPRLREVLAKAEPRDQLLGVLELLHPATAGGLLQGLIEGTWDADGADLRGSDDDLHAFSIVQSRFELLSAVHRETDRERWYGSPVSTELDDLQPDEFRERFAASDAYRAEDAITDRAARLVCDVISDHRLSVWRAQFGPEQAAELLEYLFGAAREIEGDAVDELAAGVLATMRAYARYADELLGIAADVTEITIDVIDDELSLQVVATLMGIDVNVQRRPGMADRMVAAMVADGVEIGDQVSMDAWIREFNERPFEDRDAFFEGDDG